MHLVPDPVAESAQSTASPVPPKMPLWGGRSEGALPGSVGPEGGSVSSAQESHGMPVPDRHAPSGLLGVCFLGGSLCSSLKPLGNFLGVFPGSRYLRCPSRPWWAPAFLLSRCWVVAGPGGWGPGEGSHLPCAHIWVFCGAGPRAGL